MNVAQRLKEKQAEIKEILAPYGAHRVRIWGMPETDDGAEPDVDVLVNFDKGPYNIRAIVCFRDKCLQNIKGQKQWDHNWFQLHETLSKALGFSVEIGVAGGLKNSFPVTYRKTSAACGFQ
jgi:predicted nucleotidyltransferase